MPRSRSFARVVSSISTLATSIEASPPPTTSTSSAGSKTGPCQSFSPAWLNQMTKGFW